jgi:UDP-N-acetylmuramoylalanine--D-glutamate ligase
MLTIKDVQGQLYAVMGLGRSGIATCQALQAAGAHVRAWDDAPLSRQAAQEAGIPVHDLLCFTDWHNTTALILSPGIPHRFPAPHPVAAQAQANNVPIWCDVELLIRSHPNATFVGVTGTNGKSTTTALIRHILAAHHYRVESGGNIGVPVCTLPSLGTGEIYVLELSSYQLERIPSLDMDVAVLTNLTADHLIRHGGMPGYIAAKKRIFQPRGRKQYAIISADDDNCRQILRELANSPVHKVIPISTQTPLKGGIYIENGWLKDDTLSQQQPIFSLAEVTSLRGSHNWQNILHAYAAVRALGIPADSILNAIHTFHNLPHRLESLGVIAGIEFINDSKATNPDSTAYALAACEEIYWILGGVPKETALMGLEPFYQKIRHAFTIGQATEQFTHLLQDKVPVTPCFDLSRAVQVAFQKARLQGKGIILLSPACASFDQFKDFEERGNVFRRLVEHLREHPPASF